MPDKSLPNIRVREVMLKVLNNVRNFNSIFNIVIEFINLNKFIIS